MIVNLDAFGDESYREVGFVNKYIVSKDGENFEIKFTVNFQLSSGRFSSK